MKQFRKRSLSKRLQMVLVALTMAFGLLIGGGVVQDNTASAAPYGYYDVYYGGSWHLVPQYCYSADWVVRTFYGYYNSRTCVMNHMGYYGIYP